MSATDPMGLGEVSLETKLQIRRARVSEVEVHWPSPRITKWVHWPFNMAIVGRGDAYRVLGHPASYKPPMLMAIIASAEGLERSEPDRFGMWFRMELGRYYEDGEKG